MLSISLSDLFSDFFSFVSIFSSFLKICLISSSKLSEFLFLVFMLKLFLFEFLLLTTLLLVLTIIILLLKIEIYIHTYSHNNTFCAIFSLFNFTSLISHTKCSQKIVDFFDFCKPTSINEVELQERTQKKAKKIT